MTKVCCVEDVQLSSKTLSCPMVLRSACSHRKHPHKSVSLCQKSRFHSPHGSQLASDLPPEELHIPSLPLNLHRKSSTEVSDLGSSSLENTYSLLKSYLSGAYGVFDNVNLRVETIARSEGCTEVHSKLVEKNIFPSPTSKMSMSRSNLRRSTVSSVRSLSGSEGEEDTFLERITRSRKKLSDSNSNYVSSEKSVFSEESYNGRHLSTSQSISASKNCSLHSHISYSRSSGYQSNSRDVSGIEGIRPQDSFFSKIRWAIWRCTYLKIIRNINFDVWFLSRVHKYGKYKVSLLMLLLFLLPILWASLSQDSLQPKEISDSFTSLVSPVLKFPSSLASTVYALFTKEDADPSSFLQDESSERGIRFSDSSKAILVYLSQLFSPFSDWFAKSSRNAETGNENLFVPYPTNHPIQDSVENYRESPKESQESRSADESRVVELIKKELDTLNKLQKAYKQEEMSHWAEREQRSRDEILKLRSELQEEKKLWASKETMLRAEYQALLESVDKLKKALLKQEQLNQNMDQVLKEELNSLGSKISLLDQDVKSCCEKQLKDTDVLALLETNLIAAFKNVINGENDPSSKYYFFSQWLKSQFFTQEKLLPEIKAALKKYSPQPQTEIDHSLVVKVVENTVMSHVDSIKKNLTKAFGSSSNFGQDYFSEDRVKKIIKEAIMLYDADKTGQVDYALESGGASVLSIRCTETYTEKNGKFSLFGVPLWTHSNSPRTAIQPDMQPGHCWAFKGSEGFLVLELSATIYPTGFTMEHIPLSLSPSGTIDSAPKKFSVWGLETEKDSKGSLLGEYMYDIDGEPLQYFKVQNPPTKPYAVLELKIHSNHGHIEYTCLYRFRVHGHRA